ncbi:MAG TPA: molybdenum cofactor biosynthesis protein MoaE [Oscillatoriales cyanobacterium M59_W2019_021]|nr:MAG: molybdenum cofactor biosynthesis protein MoaE [Cyanobacteria bacterium J055]HIK33518.1 molybdenum cofactor biosynthesis protein MoaE [Oscillatoriales cyanobacterium M4454_W2019_049]HIK50330.1 molybdenum cofactor biosynthesis protein MoaE [Oscillatoriales cyanobacterium M59_W2019_021]
MSVSIHSSSNPHNSPLADKTSEESPRERDQFAITFAPLSLAEIYAQADDSRNGAVVVMSGMVRDNTDGRSVEYLEYQAYAPMALQVFRQIAREIRDRWSDVTRIAIHHRTGRLTVGEISVLVAVGCPHRGEAFEACRYAIDTLKHNAPIWKKEHWADGSSSWVSIGACEATDRTSAGNG